MRIGYARVSTEDQSLDLQLDALRQAGCERVFTDKTSAVKPHRPGLSEVRSHLREGDVLVVWKLDRLGRSVKGLVDLVSELAQCDRWHRHHNAQWTLFLSHDGFTGPDGT